MPDELLDAFSKRAQQVADCLEIKLMGFRESEGRDPTRWERAAITREAAADSRRHKTGAPVTDLRQAWRDEAGELGWTGTRLTETLAAAHGPRTRRSQVSVKEVIDQLSATSSTWLPIDVMRVLCDTLPPTGTHTGPRWLAALDRAVHQVTDDNTALDPSIDGATRVSDGRSIWVEPIKANLTDQAILDQEERILAFADHTQSEKPSESRTVETNGLDPLQADAARAVAGTDKLVVVVGPAGTGKTTALARAVHDLRAQCRPVIGLAPTAKAARVLDEGANVRAETVAKLLHEWQRSTGPTDGYRLAPDTTVIVDECGMVGTGSLDALVTLAEQNRWRLVLVGDPRQLHAVGRGGLFDELCRAQPVHQLATIHRFSNTWEQTASLSLRTGSTAALDAYLGHDRVQSGSFVSHQVDIARRWINAHEDGKTVAVVAETNAHVDSLNLAIQAARLDLEQLGRAKASIGGHEQAYVGDHVVTRRNDRTLRTDQDQPIRNRDRWTVQAIGRDGSLSVAHHGDEGTVTLPADYAREHVRLGYAATAHGNQGDTVDVGLAVVTPATSHRSLYVGATRGRDENRLLVVADDLDQAREVLEQVLNNDRVDVPAVVRRRELLEQADSRPSDTGRPAEGPTRRGPRSKPAWEEKQEALFEVRMDAVERLRPFQDAIEEAREAEYAASDSLYQLRKRHKQAGFFAKSRLREPITEATQAVEAARGDLERACEAAEPYEEAFDRVDRAYEKAARIARIERSRLEVDEMQRRRPTREAPGLSL